MNRIKVWDLAVRASHLLFGVLVLGAFLTADEDESTPLHARLGVLLLGVVLFRLVWGVVGTKHARFSDFVRPPREVLAALGAMLRGAPRHFLGHNPVGAVMVVTLLGAMLVVTVTGVAVSLGPEWSGPLALSSGAAHAVKELHEGAAWSLPVLLVLHVAGVLVSSVLERQNLVLGMVTGYKRVPEGPLPASAPPAYLARAAGLAAALLVGAAAVLALWSLLPIADAEAAAPLLSVYEKGARAEDRSFAGFDAARGRALYFTEHDTKSGKTSCATCHTADPVRAGRSPVGRVIEPLAPRANPARFTDEAKAEKWFDRNCKQVLGRTCSARERGDLLTWLSTL
jgi:cytochrome b